MQVHMRLKEHKLKIFSSCRHLIRTLPALTYDKRKVEDVDTEEEDHAYDSLRYFLMSRPMSPDRSEVRTIDKYRPVRPDREEGTAWGV